MGYVHYLRIKDDRAAFLRNVASRKRLKWSCFSWCRYDLDFNLCLRMDEDSDLMYPISSGLRTRGRSHPPISLLSPLNILQTSCDDAPQPIIPSPRIP